MPFQIRYTPAALDHLRSLDTRDQRAVVDAVDRQLVHQPDVPTRNRKRLRPNDLAAWELRIGDLRVFYEIEPPDEEQAGTAGTVVILAVGIKRGNKFWIGGEECEL